MKGLLKAGAHHAQEVMLDAVHEGSQLAHAFCCEEHWGRHLLTLHFFLMPASIKAPLLCIGTCIKKVSRHCHGMPHSDTD